MIENGAININKPEGYTSHDVVARVRRKLGIRRVGHTGTLDPMATGVLPICFGKATRIIEYYDHDIKEYSAVLQLGTTTDTLDATGEVTGTASFEGLRAADVVSVFDGFKGEIYQVPPKYSALKVNGKRLYEYARAGEDVEIKKRKVVIDAIRVDDIDMPTGRVRFTVRCSKGTYIRTICDDVGRLLGVGACMAELTRTASGYFRIEDSIALENFLELPDERISDVVTDMDETLENLGKAVLLESASRLFYLNGRAIPEESYEIAQPPRDADDGGFERVYRVYGRDGEFLGISEADASTNTLKAFKIISDR